MTEKKRYYKMKRYIEWEEFEQTFPIRLNAQQKSAVQSVNGPVLLLAVPGSGKTTVLVTRLGYMIYCKGIDPEKILTVTYTVAATKDMSRRFAGYFGEELADLFARTYKHPQTLVFTGFAACSSNTLQGCPFLCCIQFFQ